MANLCAPLPVTVPPAPAPSRLRAGPLPGDRASRLPSQWGVGKGRVGGEEREEVGKRGGGAVVFQGGEGSSSLSSACLSSLGANPLPSKVVTFLHLGRAETFASNWDSLGRGILSFSFSFAPFLPSRFPFPSSSPFLPPLTGVYLQSLQWARVPRGEDYYTESQGDFAGGFTSLFKILKQCLQRLVNFGGVGWRGIGAAGRSEALTLKLCSSSWPAGEPGLSALEELSCGPSATGLEETEGASLEGRCAALPHTPLNCTLRAPGEGLCRTISGSDGRGTLLFPSNPHQSSRDSSLWRNSIGQPLEGNHAPSKMLGCCFFAFSQISWVG